MLSVACPQCHKQFKQITPEMVGRKLRCPCGFAFRLRAKENAIAPVVTTPSAPFAPAPAEITELSDPIPLPMEDFSDDPLGNVPVENNPGLLEMPLDSGPLGTALPTTIFPRTTTAPRNNSTLTGPIWTVCISLISLPFLIPMVLGHTAALQPWPSDWTIWFPAGIFLAVFFVLAIATMVTGILAVIELVKDTHYLWGVKIMGLIALLALCLTFIYPIGHVAKAIYVLSTTTPPPGYQADPDGFYKFGKMLGKLYGFAAIAPTALIIMCYLRTRKRPKKKKNRW